MEKVKGIVVGLEDSNLTIISQIYVESVNGDVAQAKNVATERYDLISKKIKASVTHDSLDIMQGRIRAEKDNRKSFEAKDSGGSIKFEIKQKATLPDGKKPKPLVEDVFGKGRSDDSVYDNFVQQLVDHKPKKQK